MTFAWICGWCCNLSSPSSRRKGRRPTAVEVASAIPLVPGEVLDESRLKDPEELAFLTRGGGVPCHLERCLGVLLDENSNLPLVDSGHGVRLVGRELDAPGGRGPFEFEHLGGVLFLCEDKVDPVRRVACDGGWASDPIPHLDAAAPAAQAFPAVEAPLASPLFEAIEAPLASQLFEAVEASLAAQAFSAVETPLASPLFEAIEAPLASPLFEALEAPLASQLFEAVEASLAARLFESVERRGGSSPVQIVLSSFGFPDSKGP